MLFQVEISFCIWHNLYKVCKSLNNIEKLSFTFLVHYINLGFCSIEVMQFVCLFGSNHQLMAYVIVTLQGAKCWLYNSMTESNAKLYVDTRG